MPVIPMRKTKSDKSEMINQVLFGENFKILKKTKNWSKIKLNHDNYQGWIDNKQYLTIKESNYRFDISNKKYSSIKINQIRQSLVLGSLVPNNKKLKNKFKITTKLNMYNMDNFKLWFVKIAKKYLNTPYLWGGRTPLGIDCSGYTQMVYRCFNKQLPRDAYQQAEKGRKISQIQNIKLGDLAFFGDKKSITHVGIILAKNKIIHASGKVRIDTLDQKGIFNIELQSYTHQLKIIKRVF